MSPWSSWGLYSTSHNGAGTEHNLTQSVESMKSDTGQTAQAYLGEDRQNGCEVCARINELQRHKVLHDGFIVSMDQVGNGFYHAILDVVINLCDQAKVQDGQATIWGPDQIARVGVGLQHPQAHS